MHSPLLQASTGMSETVSYDRKGRCAASKRLMGAFALLLLSAFGASSRHTEHTASVQHVISGAGEQSIIEEIYQDTQAEQNEQLAMLKPDDYSQGIAFQGGTSKYIWDYFLPAYNCPLREKVGIDPAVGDNGKWVCAVRTLLQRPGCLVYSFGSNGETKFETDIVRRTACEVHVFDPTLSEETGKQVGALEGVTFHPYGLGAVDGKVATNEDQTMGRGAGSIEVKKLSTIMQELGHEWVDVLKIDIEGHEWPVLEGMIADKTPFPFTQMQIEYHYFGPDSPVDPPRMLAVLQGLTARYLRVFNVEPNYWWSNQGHDFIEFAYLQVKNGMWVTGPEAPPESRSTARKTPIHSHSRTSRAVPLAPAKE